MWGQGEESPGKQQPVHAKVSGEEVMMMVEMMEVAGPERGGEAGGVYALWDEL